LSLKPLLEAGSPLPPRDLFWHYPHHQHYQLGGTMPYAAVRSSSFKLIEFFNDMHVELYDLSRDLGEANDLAASRPEVVERLRTKLHAWQAAVGAQMPTPNPDYDPSKAEYNPPKKKKTGKK
ncbi:MAG: sulfatase, partial [Pirellulaceae bacterium]